ncbi:hypothetical protein AGOR_G00183210 [Albula goreensis]|uniref:Zinc finger CCHC domain-containing protein 4 n=1 Tax=Albula goreensis TaxID=1534307 RepID=A0A8T3CX78_9TELE|nr:hypothetical protein AGOR_G00183210 [Albula goreensis]
MSDLGFAQFYSENEFCHYNMFNHHFFNGEQAEAVFSTFLCEGDSEKVVMVTDPPFGGLVKPLAHSFSQISDAWKTLQTPERSSQEMPMIWIFPYFFESRILECFPSFSMLDYQVDYDNHPLYKHGKTGRKQSPVRLFTNLYPRSVVLPEEEGYRFCSICERFIAAGNRHCSICNACTSKDGREWRHCSLCNKCVKPSWLHCPACDRCALPDHPCGRGPAGCFACGSLEHKRRACPHSAKHRDHRQGLAGREPGANLSKQAAGRVAIKKRNSAAQRSKKRKVT